jgi:hypothetical protein
MSNNEMVNGTNLFSQKDKLARLFDVPTFIELLRFALLVFNISRLQD